MLETAETKGDVLSAVSCNLPVVIKKWLKKNTEFRTKLSLYYNHIETWNFQSSTWLFLFFYNTHFYTIFFKCIDITSPGYKRWYTEFVGEESK